MNNLFKLKRQAHRLVNALFYFIFFLVGFILGGGTIEKVVSIFNSIF